MELDLADWVIRLILAAALSGLIGFEREAHQKAAGLRTHMLVGLGAALFALLSIDGFGAEDRSRIAAQVVTGVGFLGAGAIFRQGASVRGLTTAAGLWAVAAIGLAAGAGELMAAVSATVIGLVVLYGLALIERYIQNRLIRECVPFAVTMRRGANVAGIVDIAGRLDQAASDVRFKVLDENTVELDFLLHPENVEGMAALSLSVEGVLAAEQVDPKRARSGGRI